jgi:hypothetical protein
MLTVSSPVFAPAAASAARTEQAVGVQGSLLSAVVVTVKICAEAEPARARNTTHASVAMGASLICNLRSG